MGRIRRLFPVLLLLGSACTGPGFDEKQALSRRIMKVDADELLTTFRNKVQASREVSGGRPGFAAGGGCGCGN